MWLSGVERSLWSTVFHRRSPLSELQVGCTLVRPTRGKTGSKCKQKLKWHCCSLTIARIAKRVSLNWFPFSPGSFASESQIAALYELNVYTAEKNQILVRTCQVATFQNHLVLPQLPRLIPNSLSPVFPTVNSHSQPTY